MDPLPWDVAERLIDHSLPHHPRNARKCTTFNLNREVRFAAAIIAAMARMVAAIIDHSKVVGGESRDQQRLHFFGHGALCVVKHSLI